MWEGKFRAENVGSKMQVCLPNANMGHWAKQVCMMFSVVQETFYVKERNVCQ
jgi:hypothetical protein